MHHAVIDELPVWLSPSFQSVLPPLEEAWRADRGYFAVPSPDFTDTAQTQAGQNAAHTALTCEEFPSFLPLLWGALADWVLTQSDEPGFVCVAGMTAIRVELGADMPTDPEWAGHVLTEPLLGLASVGIARGVGVAGAASPMAWPGVADAIAAYGKTALEGAVAAFDWALKIQGPYAKTDYGPATGPFADALGEVPVVSKMAHLDPEETWDALAPGARVASEARQAGRVYAGALSLRGRGRVIGALDPNPLMRFRASQWR